MFVRLTPQPVMNDFLPLRRSLATFAVLAGLVGVSPQSFGQEEPSSDAPQRDEPSQTESDSAEDSEDDSGPTDDSSGQRSSEGGGKAADSETDEPETSDSETKKSDRDAAKDTTKGEGEPDRGRRFDLENLVRRARTNRDLLDEFEAKREQAEWKKYRADWARVPKLESLTTVAPVPDNADPDRLQRNYGEISNFNIGPFVNERVDLIVPIYTFGRLKTLRELADLGIDVAELKKEEAQLNAIFQVKRAYYGLQLSRAFSPILEEGDDRIDKQLQEMEDARDFGEAEFETEDLRKLQIFAAEVDSRIVDNEKLEQLSTAGLQYLAELEAEELDVGRLDTDSEPVDLAQFDDYLQAAKRHRPDLRQLNRAVEARELQVRLEKRNFYPNLFAATGLRVGWSTESTARQRVCRGDGPGGPCENVDDLWARPDSDPLNRFSINVGVGLRWKFDFVGQRGKLKERQAQLRALEAQRRRALGGVEIEIRKKYSDAYDQRKKIEINDRRLEAARRWRNQMGLTMESVAGQDFDDMEDALDPLKAFYKAKADALEARFQYAVARAALAQAVGVQNLEQVEPGGSIRPASAGGEASSESESAQSPRGE